jgi:nitrogen regulatory protein P-II 2
MKLVIAIIRPEALDNVKQSLFDADIHKMTVHNVRGCGQQKGYTENYRGTINTINLLQKVRVEIAVNDGFVQPTIDAIIRAARSGTIGDGKIFVLPIERCIRIRTGEEGGDAIG